MTGWTAAGPSVLASFLASLVEFVEALTIVLAVGAVRGWRSALLGSAAALAVLSAIVAIVGPSLARIPIGLVQIVVGTLLLLFGLRWLRKAILRTAGVLPRHDEAEAFEKKAAALRRHGAAAGRSIDPLAFATSFKIVMLEGTEVVFIVIAIGAGGRLLVPASIGAALALGVVVMLGLALHRPLSKVPENALKFGVGVMLAAFGTFWVGEGLGVVWPGSDWAGIALMAAFLLLALALTGICARRPRAPSRGAAAPGPAAPARTALGVVAAELWDLFVDDGWLAVGVVAWIAAWLSLPIRERVADDAAAALLFAAGPLAALAASAWRRARG